METTDYYEREARRKHPGIADEWVERVLSIPQSQELQPDGRVRYFGYIAEAGKWLRVVVADGKCITGCSTGGNCANGAPMKLSIYYDPATDTLSLWNSRAASDGDDVADNLTADFDQEGGVVGFTLEHATELLAPVLSGRHSETVPRSV